MNAVLDAKQAQAAKWIADVPLPEDWRKARAEAARDWLMANGAPHKRDHYWSYTNPQGFDAPLGDQAAEAHAFDGVALTPQMAHNDDGLQIAPIAARSHALYGRLVAKAHENGARPVAERVLLGAQGVMISVTSGAHQIVFNRDDWEDAFYLGISVAPGAKLTMIETGQAPRRQYALMEAELGEAAEFHHLRIAGNESAALHGHLFGELQANAKLHSFTLSKGAQFRRFESVIDLEGDTGHVSVAGADLLTGKSFQDDTVYITHNAEHCTSRQVFKRVVGAGATSVFQGKILVKAGAQKTDGYQISQGLMLEDGGEVLSKPELEIYADDVACSHGSTTASLDEEALFYLRSRGVPMAAARKLLVRAFVDEALDEIADDGLQARFAEIAEDWIGLTQG